MGKKDSQFASASNLGYARYVSYTAIFFLGLVLGGGVDYLYFDRASTTASIGSSQVRGNTKYSFINPLLECEVSQGTIDSRKQNFGGELRDLVENLKSGGKASEIAVYYRDLNNGPTVGINQDELFIPASLLKVPVMMAYFKLAESNPSILDKELYFKKMFTFPNEGNEQLIKPSKEITPGRNYKVSELIEASIKHSDNQAVFLLLTNISEGSLHELYTILGVNDSSLRAGNARLSVKNYSAFFRILFNSSFIEDRYSDRALKILSQTEFGNGIVAGVPEGMVVSHKFGESGYLTGERQLHDCGIIYFPDHPYLLCIMSRGKTTKNLEESIKTISKFVYEKIDSQY